MLTNGGAHEVGNELCGGAGAAQRLRGPLGRSHLAAGEIADAQAYGARGQENGREGAQIGSKPIFAGRSADAL